MKIGIFLSLTLAACRLYSQDDPLLRHIPPDADAIYHFNLAALTWKLPWNQLTAPIPAPQHNTENRIIPALLRDPDRAGVDLSHEVFIVITGDHQPGRPQCLTALLHLTDTARWAAFLRELSGLHDTFGAVWNDHTAVLTFLRRMPPQITANEARGYAIRHSDTLLQGYDTSALDTHFRSGIIDDADIHAWTHQGDLTAMALRTLFPPRHPSSTTGPRILPGYCFSTLRFEKGAINIKSISTLPAGYGLYEKLISHPPPVWSMQKIPVAPVMGFASLRFDPDVIGDLLTQLQIRGAVEGFLFDKGLSLESFVHAFQGDFAVIAQGKSNPSLYFLAALHDIPAVWQWTSRLPGSLVRDSLLIISASQNNTFAWFNSVHQDTSKGMIAPPPTIPDGAPLPPTRSAPLVGFINCKALAARLPGNQGLRVVFSLLDNFDFAVGGLNADGEIENRLRLSFTDKQENSLKCLLKIF